MAYQLINLGNGTFGAHDAATGMARSFSSEANAKQFLGVPNIDYTKAIAPTFDFNQLLGNNADKLVNVSSKVQGPTNPTPTQVLQNNANVANPTLGGGSPFSRPDYNPNTGMVGNTGISDLLARPNQPGITAPPTPLLVQNGPPNSTNSGQTAPTATTQNLTQGGMQGLIGTRTSAINPHVTEYFNTQTGQGFADPKQLFDFVSKQSGQKISSFDQVNQMLNPKQPSNAPSAGSQADPSAGSSSSAATTTTGDGAGGINPDGTPKQTVEQNTVQKYTDDYKKILTDLGLPTLKTTIDDTAKKLNDINDEKLKEIQTTNDNPWLDENSRRKQIANIDERYQGKLALQTSLLTMYNNMYSTGVTQANTIMGDVTADLKMQQENAQKALEANQKIVLDYGVSKPFYSVDGQTMIRASDGKVYSSYNDWVKDGGNPSSFQMIGGLMTKSEQAKFQNDLFNADTSRINADANALDAATNKYKAENPNGTAPGTQSAYSVETNNRIVASVDELMGKVTNSTVSLQGKLYSNIPGTDAYNFKAQLDTLKANIAFGALQQMRDASKTGGALGQISDTEEKLLSSTLGALDVGQSPEQFKQQLQKIKDSISRWNQAATGSTTSGGGVIEYNGKKYQTDGNGNFDPLKPISFNSVGNTKASYQVATNEKGPLALTHPDPKNVIAGIDLTTYATDPNHEKNVKNIYTKISSTIRSEQDLEAYIQKTAKGSPVRASDITQAAKQYNVDPYLMVAIMQQDSSLGTRGKAIRTHNPGNVGNTDSGATQGFATWQDGIMAVAKNLSKRRVGPAVPNTYA